MRIVDMPLSRDSIDDRRRHIVPHEDGWAVKTEGSRRATAVFRYKSEALEYGIGVCRRRDGLLVVHRRDGTIQSTRDYA